MSDAPPPPPPQQQPGPAPDAAEAPKKPWWKRWWGVALLAFLGLIVLGALLGEEPTDDDDPVAAESPAAEPEPTEPEPTEQEPTEQEPTEDPEPAAAMDDGTFVVGEDVQPGTYRSLGQTTFCYWARLSGFSGELDDVITNGNQAPEIITIAESDAGFETQGCGGWAPAEQTLPEEPASEFTDGTFTVGGHIQPGTYRADGAGDNLCYWARLSGFSGELGDVVTNGNSPTTIEISDADAGFTALGCGTWTRAG